MKTFIYISLLSQVSMFCLGSGPTKEEDLGEVWKMFEKDDTFSEYSKMLGPTQELPKNDIFGEYDILNVPELDPNYDTATFSVATHSVAAYDPRTTEEREPYYENGAKSTKAEQQVPPSPPPTTLISSQPMPSYVARNIPPPTLLAGQRTVSLPPPPTTSVPNQSILSYGMLNVPSLALHMRHIPAPPLCNSAIMSGTGGRFLPGAFKPPLSTYNPAMPSTPGGKKAQKPHEDQMQEPVDKKVQKPRGPRSKKRADPTPAELDKVLKNRFPFSSSQETKKITVTEKRVTGDQSVAIVPSSRPWLTDQHKGQNASYNPRIFESAEGLGIISLISGLHTCIPGTDRLTCRYINFGLRIAAKTFQILPSLKQAESKRKQKNHRTEKDTAEGQNSVEDCDRKGVPNAQWLDCTSDTTNGRALPRLWNPENVTEKQIKDILEKVENEGGIIGKIEDDYLEIYSSGSPLYLAFMYRENSIICLELNTPIPVQPDDVLFLVPDGFTGRMIRECLHHGLHTKVLECMSSKFYGEYYPSLWGDFVIATIG